MSSQAVDAEAERIAAALRGSAADVEVLGPAPDPLPKARGEYRARVALKATGDEALLAAAAHAQTRRRVNDTRLTIVVDPR